MARQPRFAVAGYAHHVTQCSVGQLPAFLDDADRAAYLAYMYQAASDSNVTLQAYVLMNDHVHIVATPSRHEGLGQMMQRIGRRYVARFNKLHQRSGTLWAGRFRAAVLDPERFVLCCLTHIERNPMRHRLVERVEDWPWSSAPHHLGLDCNPMLVNPPAYWQLGNTPFERESAYRRLLDNSCDTDPDVRRLREASRRGRAVGSVSFVDALQQRTGSSGLGTVAEPAESTLQPVPS